jgi:nitrogenase subunit NifH
MISRNKLKKATTGEGMRNLSTKTKIKYLEDLKSQDSLTNTHKRAMAVLEADENVQQVNNFKKNRENISSATSIEKTMSAVKNAVFGETGILSY